MAKLEEQPCIFLKKPSECTKQDLEEFAQLVKLGGEVDEQGLDDRINRAEILIFLKFNLDLIGVAALKKPSSDYKTKVFRKAKSNSKADDYEFELGWTVVHPTARRQGYSHRLVEAVVESSHGKLIFATSRSVNHSMHHVLKSHGFEFNGLMYSSTRGHYDLVLLTQLSTEKDF